PCATLMPVSPTHLVGECFQWPEQKDGDMTTSSYEARVGALAQTDRKIDLRSDTVTHPTQAMREAMYRAEVGDDVYGEDPTVNRLQELGAELLGKEAALLVLSGTMGNLLGILSQTRSGDEAVVGRFSHIFLNEAGGAAALGGVQLFPIESHRGVLDPQTVEAAIRDPNNLH